MLVAFGLTCAYHPALPPWLDLDGRSIKDTLLSIRTAGRCSLTCILNRQWQTLTNNNSGTLSPTCLLEQQCTLSPTCLLEQQWHAVTNLPPGATVHAPPPVCLHPASPRPMQLLPGTTLGSY